MDENIKPKQDYPPKITGGLILILLGVLFLFTEMDRISWTDWWAYFLVGLGGIFLLEGALSGLSRPKAAAAPGAGSSPGLSWS